MNSGLRVYSAPQPFQPRPTINDSLFKNNEHGRNRMHISFVHRTAHRTAHRTDQHIPNRLQRHIAGTLLLLIAAASSLAGALDVPPALAPWQGWVLDQHRDAQCTRVALSLSQRICVWPGRLQLAVSEKGGSFSQTLQVEAAG